MRQHGRQSLSARASRAGGEGVFGQGGVFSEVQKRGKIPEHVTVHMQNMHDSVFFLIKFPDVGKTGLSLFRGFLEFLPVFIGNIIAKFIRFFSVFLGFLHVAKLKHGKGQIVPGRAEGGLFLEDHAAHLGTLLVLTLHIEGGSEGGASLHIAGIPGESLVPWPEQTILTEKEELCTIIKSYPTIIALSQTSLVAQMVKHLPVMTETWV